MMDSIALYGVLKHQGNAHAVYDMNSVYITQGLTSFEYAHEINELTVRNDFNLLLRLEHV